jgi:hypothetical protein
MADLLSFITAVTDEIQNRIPVKGPGKLDQL